MQMYEHIIGEDCSCTDIIIPITLRTEQDTLNNMKAVCNYYMFLTLLSSGYSYPLPRKEKETSLMQHFVLPLSQS